MRSIVVLSLLSILPVAFGAGYDRDAFSYRSYKPDSVVGAYTGERCDLAPLDVAALSLPEVGSSPRSLEELIGSAAALGGRSVRLVHESRTEHR